MLFVELLQVIFWFNPLIYFVKHSIKMNHEFLADQAVLNRGISASNYQHILLAFSSDAVESPLANAINYSSTRHAIGVIKKRFTVMKTQTSKRSIWLKSVLLLPILALTLYGFSEKKEVMKPLSNQNLSSDNIQNKTPNNESNVLSLTKKKIYENTKQESFYTVSLNYKGLYLVNNQLGNIEDIENDFKAIAADKNKFKTIVFRYERDTPQAAIDQFMGLVKKYNLKTDPWNPEDNPSTGKVQIKATSEEISEYNKLARFYNNQSDDSYVLKIKDMARISEIYKIMDESQKAKAEPYPNFPPPPPPTPATTANLSSQMIQTLPPPPPPPSAALSA